MVYALQEHTVSCPYCGEIISVVIDGSVESQEYIEDCEVCCRPITFNVQVDQTGIYVQTSHENE
ncbi:MAG TPA: CPXCG motif-containing cysteine-rich protein [Methylophaga aminisulfidivorans]|jgi:hypothetical protein|uniref:CPXCG motif-containing cysteine-rich protein n=1 Tax=Methylophaga TaxID=40222 RepID=UPI001766D7B3|nr:MULTISPECIES: CPXCG motif-containing cysteine-rich protein [Methylophaga]HIC45986.1 CPXCG motif-containing cysteine-rich protein [Methylophaga sp.]HIM40322.1 CPXCG motif-containing cysteine-rich protein [Methylophaga aminisulfidivorans]